MKQTEWDGFRSPKERAGTLPNSSLPPPEPGTEEDLLARALRRRDEAAFDALLDRLHSPMLRLAQVFARSREDAEEVVQDTWLAALSGIDRFQGRSSLKTWLFRILVNRARTRGKREARTVSFSALAASAQGGPDELRAAARIGEAPRAGTELFLSEEAHRTRNGPEDEFLAAELRHQVESAVAGLPTRQREVVTLRDLEGWSAEEVCELLGLSEANQRVLLHRARVRVRDALVPYMAADGAADPAGPTCRVRVSDRPPQRPPVAGRRRGRPAPAVYAVRRWCRASSSRLFIPGGMRSRGTAASRSMVQRIWRRCRRHPAQARRWASNRASVSAGSAPSRYSVVPVTTCSHPNDSYMRLAAPLRLRVVAPRTRVRRW